MRPLSHQLETQVQERQEELRAIEAQLRQFQKMDAIGTLAGGVAHDFNNILGSILMYCDLLEDQADSGEEVRDIAHEIRTVSGRGAALTRQLLIFSRKQIMNMKPIDLNELIDSLLKMLHRLIGESVAIVPRLSSDLWKISADSSQIEQVLLNLTINARDAMPDGGKIFIETSNINLTEDFSTTHLNVAPGPHVVLTVTDTGCGMSPDVQDRLFEPFFTTKAIGKGTGLGLSTVYGIVKQSKGSIWVYSEIGKGTIFKIYFPATDEESAPVTTSEIYDISKELANRTLLLVEDEERLRRLFASALEKAGYKVLVAENGAEALLLFEKHQKEIDLLLTNVVMPQMGGIELAKLTKKQKPDLKILYMSGYAQDANAELLQVSAEVEFIQKPFDTSALLQRLKKILKDGA